MNAHATNITLIESHVLKETDHRSEESHYVPHTSKLTITYITEIKYDSHVITMAALLVSGTNSTGLCCRRVLVINVYISRSSGAWCIGHEVAVFSLPGANPLWTNILVDLNDPALLDAAPERGARQPRELTRPLPLHLAALPAVPTLIPSLAPNQLA